ncbi:MAG: hypothetical protein SGI86_21750 [Deltaproteobacteria bacterium]|nr:hypothetical protein [Deltaproteobacteria bacterium]
MALVFEEVHPAPDRKKTNLEWFVLANHTANPVNTAGLRVVIAAKGQRGSVIGQIDPGFILQPGEKILVVTGVPGKKALGEPPTREGLRTYHLFSREPLLRGKGCTVMFARNQMEVAKVTYDPDAPVSAT